jgi:predicted aspartyl protease
MKRRMGTFHIAGEFASLRRPNHFRGIPRMLVDTGSEYTWIPAELLREAGVVPAKKDLEFLMANGQTITRSVGYVVLRAQGFETVDEAVFGEPGDLVLLGARTLEGFGARVDTRAKRLVASGPHPAASGHLRFSPSSIGSSHCCWTT